MSAVILGMGIAVIVLSWGVVTFAAWAAIHAGREDDR